MESLKRFSIGCVFIATGAYGREAKEKDWKNGKDFQVCYGPYFSIRDVQAIKNEGYKFIKFIGGSTPFLIELQD